MFWNREITRPFGKFFIEEEKEDDGRIDIYDSHERWMSYIDYETEEEKKEIIFYLETVKTLKAFLAHIGIEYQDIIEGFDDAVNYAYENGYLDECDEAVALFDNDWVNVIGDSIIFILEN